MTFARAVSALSPHGRSEMVSTFFQARVKKGKKDIRLALTNPQESFKLHSIENKKSYQLRKKDHFGRVSTF